MDPAVVEASEALNAVLAETKDDEPFNIYTATQEEMNAHGMCGYFMSTGKRCSKPITVWFGEEDPTLVNPNEGRLGACGKHAKAVEEEVKSEAGSLQRRQIEKYIAQQEEKAVNVLRNAGLQARLVNSYRRGHGIIIENYGLLLAWLDQQGLNFDDRDWQKVAQERIDAEAAKVCKNCWREHELDELSYSPGCDQYMVHRFFPRKNNKDLCDVCGGPPSTLLHDESMLGKG